MFIALVGQVGAGKTYTMVKYGMEAFEKGEKVFSLGVDIDVSGWDDSKGGKYERLFVPTDLLSPDIRCGTVLWDELGAFVNNREHEFWPHALTIKIIEHRKAHLDFVATVQDDELADKNIRRFYNKVYKIAEHRFWFVGKIWKNSSRNNLECPHPGCNKGDKCLTKGDRKSFPWPGTWYSAYHMNPKYTQNKEKHESQGTIRYLYDPKVANAYASSDMVSKEARQYFEQIKQEAHAKGFRRFRK